MNLRSSIIMLATAMSSIGMYAAQSLPVKLQTPPATSPVTQSYDEATDTYTIHITGNSWADDATRPTVRTAELTEVLPSFARTLAFEYKCTNPCSTQKFFMYKMFKGTITRRIELDNFMTVSDDWQTYRISLGTYVDGNAHRYGQVLGQYQDIIFMDFLPDTDLYIRNLHYEDEELPFIEQTLTPGTTSFIEAENFNMSATEGRNFANRRNKFERSNYTHPTPGEFPIYAFTSVDYQQQFVSDDFMENMKATADLMNKKYRDMEAAGFNITEGGAYSAIDQCFLFDGLTNFNGYQANLHDGIEKLKLILRSNVTTDNNVVLTAKNSDRCAGYHIKDEPHMSQIPEVGGMARKVRELDNTRMLYGNLLNINCIPGDYGAKSFDQYMSEFIEQTGMSVISYDYYAVRTMGDIVELDPKEHPEVYTPTREYTFLMPNFFMNMEVASKLSKYYNIPWWGFTRAMSGLKRTNPSSVYCKGNFIYPAPTEDHMRVQAFSLMCYGAQGLQYWPYVNCDGCYDAPCAIDGSLNPSYYYAKAINTEVKALTWVFLGAQLVQVGHTNAVTPDGCVRLTKALMPEGVSAVTTSGQGMPVSTLQNGNNLFMMAVNPDLWDAQDITVTLDHAAKLVNPDGTTTPVAAGTHTTNLLPGRYLIYLLDENVPELKLYGLEPVYDNYRDDETNVPITAHSAASNGFYMPNMGNHAWSNYSLLTPIEETRTITRDQALENWGAWYAYTFDVAEDMTVDISIGHSVPWSEYGRVASIGAKPGDTYTIEDEPELNWPKQYAASMTLSLDGETVMPAHSIRPAVPAEFDEAGTEFNAILADKSRWISTVGDENLYFWPKAGGDDDVTPRYNAAPDYRGVKLTAGTHRFVVKSNCYPWNFDNIKIAPADLSGIDNLVDDNAAATLKATAVAGGILVETDADFTVYSLAGVAVAAGHGSQLVDINAGLYVVVSNNTSIKVLVK